jgi:pimeloyl-ACP methyl ester carboxylesterase
VIPAARSATSLDAPSTPAPISSLTPPACSTPTTEEFGRFLSTARVDWSDPDSVIDYLVDYSRVLAGGRRPFDESEVRALVRRDVERARDFAATRNHDAIPDDGRRPHASLSSVAAPTLVMHGTADPMFPIEHGAALADEIPGARLMRLEGAGHGVDRADWASIVRAILEHTNEDERD